MCIQVPKSAFSYEVRVCESDTDHNRHTNQATYIRYCCDATHTAVSGSFSGSVSFASTPGATTVNTKFLNAV